MLIEPKCHIRHCKHYQGVKQPDGTEMTEVNYCLAFPDGIPNEIGYGTDKHSDPFPNQGNSYVYQKGKFSWED